MAHRAAGSHPGVSAWSDIKSQAKLLLWFTWPAWPLAVWTLWRWRHQLRARHVALPLLFALVPLAATLTTDFSERSLLLALPAMATLAAFALPTFRRSVAALIDWFTLLFFSGSAIIIWVIWISLQTGVPAKPAANVAKLAPGFVHEFSALPFVFALAGTIRLVLAGALAHRGGIGRPCGRRWLLPAGGAALSWLLVMTLWLPALDYARSYAPQVHAIAQRVGQPVCIAELGLGPSADRGAAPPRRLRAQADQLAHRVPVAARQSGGDRAAARHREPRPLAADRYHPPSHQRERRPAPVPAQRAVTATRGETRVIARHAATVLAGGSSPRWLSA